MRLFLPGNAEQRSSTMKPWGKPCMFLSYAHTHTHSQSSDAPCHQAGYASDNHMCEDIMLWVQRDREVGHFCFFLQQWPEDHHAGVSPHLCRHPETYKWNVGTWRKKVKRRLFSAELNRDCILMQLLMIVHVKHSNVSATSQYQAGQRERETCCFWIISLETWTLMQQQKKSKLGV